MAVQVVIADLSKLSACFACSQWSECLAGFGNLSWPSAAIIASPVVSADSVDTSIAFSQSHQSLVGMYGWVELETSTLMDSASCTLCMRCVEAFVQVWLAGVVAIDTITDFDPSELGTCFDNLVPSRDTEKLAVVAEQNWKFPADW